MEYAKLKHYLEFAGILSCNSNPYLPSLPDLGYCWQDITEAINAHELFYSKVFRNRTVYLSNRVYFLLKQIFLQKPLRPEAEIIYSLLEDNILETSEIKRLSCFDTKTYTSAFNFLLENMYITAYKDGKPINPNWSTFVYSTASYWENHVEKTATEENPQELLKDILTRTMSEEQFLLLVKSHS
ncbi:MAG: hypothetical protein LBS19_00590 [Clostridiales bacterium]|jgi:hypothetical protein|nr:hypothetical protein [Clostridiales bacterium]